MRRILTVIMAIACMAFVPEVSHAQEVQHYGQEFEAGQLLSPGRLPYVMAQTANLSDVKLAGYVTEMGTDNGVSWMKIRTNPESKDNILVKLNFQELPSDELINKLVIVYGDVAKKATAANSLEKKVDPIASPATGEKNVFVMEAKGLKMN